MLVTTSRDLGEQVLTAVARLLETLADGRGRRRRRGGTTARWCVVADREEAAAVADARAPEHLEVHAADAGWWRERLRNYGSLFLGDQATVAYGDKAVGTNHVLPDRVAPPATRAACGSASSSRRVTYQELTAEGTRAVAPAVAAISHAEGFGGHAITAEMRLARAERDRVTGLDGAVVVVTGATGGLGARVRPRAAPGGRPASCCSAARAPALARAGGRARARRRPPPCDVTDARAGARRVRAAAGRPTSSSPARAATGRQPFLDVTDEDLDVVVAD